MNKKNIINLIRVHVEKDEKSFKVVAYNIADEFDADTIILATGSKQIVPPIQGIDQEFVLQAEDILEDQKKLKGNIVVIGGGLVGTETCNYLGSQGAHVTLVEMKDNIAAGYKARNELAEELSKKYDVKVVGDASSPRRILDATAEAYNVVNEL